MVEEEAGAGVQLSDAGHLVLGEVEVEDVEVLGHPVAPHGLGNDDDAALDEPTENDLGNRLLVRGADVGEDRVGEEVVAASAKGPQDSIWTPRPRMSSWSAWR